MKLRKPISHNHLQPNLSENEFVVLSEFMNEVVVTSTQQSSQVIGNPFLNLAIREGIITGIYLTFEELNGLSSYQFAKTILSHEIKFPDSIRHDISVFPWEGKPTRTKSQEHGQADSGLRKITITIEGEKLYDSSLRLVIRKIKSKIVERLKDQITLDGNKSICTSLTELYTAVITEVEFYNHGMNSEAEQENSISQNIGSREGLKISEALYSSIIYEKRLWWLNLKSKEVTVDKMGIHYKGKCFTPTDADGYNCLCTILNDQSRTTVTVYPSSQLHSKLFWVHQMHFIPLTERNEHLQTDEVQELIFQSKSSIMKKEKSTTVKIRNDRHANRRTAKIESSRFDERQNKSTFMIPKLQSNCEYLLSCYLA
ncbi:MAG TPA: hypothetical protein PKL56_11865 [Cyclobacteriaceae bacterium]|nr:hypothetical protein [Cyclobacteriaceae bacterium]HMV07490.1 hypothetical protein [Cyclobacteriaceae bacterium]HMW99155.1 hypothetical protein [Cyclobacteriaceae bacterium]HMX48212.1 hypothetical protein [Cyclobacteriaceae bacterium]HMY95017.1 hypothetical protein [Cyclobacteriaceae bacterium]